MSLLCRVKHNWKQTKVASFTFWRTGEQCSLEDKVCERCGKVQNLRYDREIIKIIWKAKSKDGWILGLEEVIGDIKEA